MTPTPRHPHLARAIRASLCLLFVACSAQVRAQEANRGAGQTSDSAVRTSASPNTSQAAIKAPGDAKPSTWNTLGPTERQALAPLAGSWDSIPPSQQRKWRELSRNFSSLPASEQDKMQQRMREWAALSPQERARARLNFGKTAEVARELTPAEKLAKWQAYQALPAEQRQKLADQAKAKSQGAAPAAQPVPTQKLAVVPPISTARAIRASDAPAESPDAADNASSQ
jgi:hypothetical protein